MDMLANDLLEDAFGRVREVVQETVEGLDIDELAFRPQDIGNSIAWLIWHLTRIQDDHVSELAGQKQAWIEEKWYEKFALPFDTAATGYGHTSDEVSQVRVGGELLLGYHEAVYERTITYLKTLNEKDYAEIIDRSWDPPVTRAVRLVSVITDDLQHAGQAAYVRGLLMN